MTERAEALTARLNADEIVGERVHQLMWRRQIPQRELAEQLRLDQSTLSKKLRGRRTWMLDELLTAARFLGVEYTDLMPGV
jgi:transcriptional regulator with XRE-family HTH domain